MSFVVGLTGGIGSGKSTVADLFAEYGIPLIDTDVIARELTEEGGAAMPDIRAAFGDTVIQPNGALDRVAMRRLVFSDATAKAQLEAVLHPRIRRESERRCKILGEAPYALLIVPLLIESQAYRDQVQRILVVDCDEATQIGRVMARSGLSGDEVRAIMSTQASRVERLAAADDVIANEGDRQALIPQVLALHRRYCLLVSGA